LTKKAWKTSSSKKYGSKMVCGTKFRPGTYEVSWSKVAAPRPGRIGMPYLYEEGRREKKKQM